MAVHPPAAVEPAQPRLQPAGAGPHRSLRKAGGQSRCLWLYTVQLSVKRHTPPLIAIYLSSLPGHAPRLIVVCLPALPIAAQESTDPEDFVLHPHPIDYNYNEFERLLLGMAWHIYVTKKRGEAFEEYLGEMLDNIFKKAGILLEVAKDKHDADE